MVAVIERNRVPLADRGSGLVDENTIGACVRQITGSTLAGHGEMLPGDIPLRIRQYPVIALCPADTATRAVKHLLTIRAQHLALVTNP